MLARALAAVPIIASLALTSGSAHAAAGPTNFVGKSDQGLPVSAVVRKGKIDRIKLQWSAPCSMSGWLWGPLGTVWFNREPAPFDVSGKRFSDKGEVERPFQIGKVVMDQKLSGRMRSNAITGVQSSTVRLFDATGKKQDECTSTVHFRVAPKRAAG